MKCHLCNDFNFFNMTQEFSNALWPKMLLGWSKVLVFRRPNIFAFFSYVFFIFVLVQISIDWLLYRKKTIKIWIETRNEWLVVGNETKKYNLWIYFVFYMILKWYFSGGVRLGGTQCTHYWHWGFGIIYIHVTSNSSYTPIWHFVISVWKSSTMLKSGNI